jgi:hypothetical protein
LPTDTQAGITERTAALRYQMRERQAQNTRLDAVEAGINAAYKKRWHRLCGRAALYALAALFSPSITLCEARGSGTFLHMRVKHARLARRYHSGKTT